LSFSNGSTYEHAQNSGTVPTATWDITSTCLVTGETTTLPSGVTGQTLGNLTWNCPGQTNTNTALSGTLTVAGNLTIVSTGVYSFRVQSSPITVGGNLTISGGVLWIAGNTGKDLIVGGNVSMSGDTLEVSNSTTTGRLLVAGNFSHTAGVIDKRGTGVGEIIFNGSSDQIFSSTGTISGLVDFAIIKTSGVVTLGSNVTLPDTLNLKSGKITLGNNNLTIASGGTVASATSANYVVTDGTGKLVRNGVGTSAVSFPVGTSSSYNPVTVRTGSSTDNFSVRVIGSVSPSSANDAAAVQRTWDISEETPGGNGTITFTVQWNSGEQGASFDRTRAEGWRNTGTAWVVQTGSMTSITSGSTYPAVATVGTTSLSNWIIANSDGALPIQMASFAANVIRDNQVEVAWRTASETNNYGFEIYRKRGDAGEWAKVSFVQGHGTTLAPQSYTYVDAGLGFGKYIYQIKQVDLDGKSQTFPEMSVNVGVGPDRFVLAQNYPNPFNPSTIVEFVVPQSGFATMKVYNVLGQEVASLFEGNAEAGKINTARFNASNLPSGMYFYMLRSAGKVESKRMLLMK
jgi:hypothetical protein